MKLRSSVREEIVLASTNRNLCNDFKQESSFFDYVLDTVDSPQKFAALCRENFHPALAVIDLDTVQSRNLNSFIFYLRKFKKTPIVVISVKTNIPGLAQINKNLPVLMSLTCQVNRKNIRELFANLRDLTNEDLKKKLSRVEYLEEENTFACTFVNKEVFFVKRSHIQDDDTGSRDVLCTVSPDGYFFRIKYANGKSTEVPWDFIRSIADQDYEFYQSEGKKKNGKETAEALGERISKAREMKKMTQDDLAAKTGILRNNISRIENGHHHTSLPVLEKIAEALDIPVFQLLAK